MGFGDFAKKAAKAGLGAVQAGADAMQAKMERIERYKEQYDRLDDKHLIRKYKSSTGEQKMACAMLLKERGYGSQTTD